MSGGPCRACLLSNVEHDRDYGGIRLRARVEGRSGPVQRETGGQMGVVHGRRTDSCLCVSVCG